MLTPVSPDQVGDDRGAIPFVPQTLKLGARPGHLFKGQRCDRRRHRSEPLPWPGGPPRSAGRIPSKLDNGRTTPRSVVRGVECQPGGLAGGTAESGPLRRAPGGAPNDLCKRHLLSAQGS